MCSWIETLNNKFLCAQLTSFRDNNVPLNLISRETLKRKWLNSIREIEFVQFGGTLSRPKDKIEICQESVNEFEQIFIGLGVSENVYKFYMNAMMADPFHDKQFVKRIIGLCRTTTTTKKKNIAADNVLTTDENLYKFRLYQLFAYDDNLNNENHKPLSDYAHNLAIGSHMILDCEYSIHALAIRNMYRKTADTNLNTFTELMRNSLDNHNTPAAATQSQSQELFLQDYEREMCSYLSNKQLQEYYIKNLITKRSRKDKISKNNPSELVETRE